MGFVACITSSRDRSIHPDSPSLDVISKTQLRPRNGNAACSSLCAAFYLLPCLDVCSRLRWCRSPLPRTCPIPRGCCAFQLPTAARSSFVTPANFTLWLKKVALLAELPADQVTLPSRASPPTGRNSL